MPCSCTYVGAAKLKELSKRTTFIRVHSQLNEVSFVRLAFSFSFIYVAVQYALCVTYYFYPQSLKAFDVKDQSHGYTRLSLPSGSGVAGFTGAETAAAGSSSISTSGSGPP
jgi:hypothetical protein